MSTILYHEKYEERTFNEQEIKNALKNGWVDTPVKLSEKRLLYYFPDCKIIKPRKGLFYMTVPELKEEAAEYGIEFEDGIRRHDMIKIIKEARDDSANPD